METRRYTEAEILALNPCYTAAQIRAAFGRDQALTLQQIADRELVPSADRLWVLWRLLPTDVRRVAVERVVTRAVRQYALPEPSTRAWAERWLAGNDRTAAAAWAAEEVAVCAEPAAASAARAAASAAECEPASEAAVWSSRAAEWAAEWAAARAAAEAAECEPASEAAELVGPRGRAPNGAEAARAEWAAARAAAEAAEWAEAAERRRQLADIRSALREARA